MTLEHFDAVWSKMAARGQCDGIGGSEYRRVGAKWLSEGCNRNEPLEHFIYREANIVPSGRVAVYPSPERN